MNYEIVYDEKALFNMFSKISSCPKEIVQQILNHQLESYQSENYHLYNLEYFYDHRNIQDECIVLSSSDVDEYIFNEVISHVYVPQHVIFLVTQNVGRLFIENFNAKMKYKKWKEG